MYSVAFNAENTNYEAIITRYKAFDPTRGRYRSDDYAHGAPISFITNIEIHEKEALYPWMKYMINAKESSSEEKKTKPVQTDWKNYTKKTSHMIPFQFIGFKKDYEEEYEDFAEAVIDGFDLSCCQFAIEDPYKPAVVRALNDISLDLFSRFQFRYDVRKFTNIHIFCSRVRKYIDRGYMFVGMQLGDYRLYFDNAILYNLMTDTEHSAGASHATSLFGIIRSNPGAIDRTSSTMSGDTRSSKSTLSEGGRKREIEDNEIKVGRCDPETSEAKKTKADGTNTSVRGSLNKKDFIESTNSCTDDKITLQAFDGNQSKMKLFGAVETVMVGDSTQLCLHTPLLRNFHHPARSGASPSHYPRSDMQKSAVATHDECNTTIEQLDETLKHLQSKLDMIELKLRNRKHINLDCSVIMDVGDEYDKYNSYTIAGLEQEAAAVRKIIQNKRHVWMMEMTDEKEAALVRKEIQNVICRMGHPNDYESRNKDNDSDYKKKEEDNE